MEQTQLTDMSGSSWERSFLRKFTRELLRAPGALIGLLLVVAIVFGAIFAPVLVSHPPTKMNLFATLDPPSWAGGAHGHVLGTDDLGRDLLSRILYGARTSLAIGLTAVVVATLVGTLLGMLAAYFGGYFDNIISGLAEVQYTFPFMLLALVVIAVLGASPTNTVIVLALNGWVYHGRLSRSLVLQLRDAEYIQAARVLGQSDATILRKHILPNILPSVIVLSTLQLPIFLVLESSLTFLGLGPNPAIPTWGGMLADGRQYLTVAWWVATFPGIAITLSALGVNLFGDWFRDFIDPQL